MKTVIPTITVAMFLVIAVALFKLAYNLAGPDLEPNATFGKSSARSHFQSRIKPLDSDSDANRAAQPTDTTRAQPSLPTQHRVAARDHWTDINEAVDQIAAEVLDSLEDRPVLLVWLFDRTPTASDQRQSVIAQLERIYAIFNRQTAHKRTTNEHSTASLVSVVGAFSNSVEFLTPEPTGDTRMVLEAAESSRPDAEAEPRPFSAIDEAANNYAFASASKGRRLLFVVVTNQVGDDSDRVDELVTRLRRLAIPLYVIGVPAPFGSNGSLAAGNKDSGGQLKQGPESLDREVLNLGGWNGPREPLDSGFGPFALCRLAVTSGGRHLAVRPITLYDPQAMALHTPDYVSHAAYEELLTTNQARGALVEAAKQPHIDLSLSFETRFPKKDEASLKRLLDKAQQAPARLEPQLRELFDRISKGEADRSLLKGLRWQAGFDLAIGLAAAARARVEGYNAALAQLKAGRAFPDARHTIWVLQPTKSIKGDSSLEKLAERAHKYLERVASEHRGTPWAIRASQELTIPLGWEWTSK